jgi:hypothetical protein
VYMAVAVPASGMPEKSARHELAQGLSTLFETCSCVHLVIEGSGFLAASQRAAAAGIFLLAGRRGRASTHASLADALRECQHLQAPAAAILAGAQAQGLISPVAAASGERP